MSSTDEQKVERLRPRVPCPECGSDSTRQHFPFCSPRCKDIDLNRWLSGSYVIPGRPENDEDGSE